MFERAAEAQVSHAPGEMISASPSALTATLQRLRAFVHQRLDQIEAIALELIRAAATQAGESEQRLRELRERQEWLEAEIQRREREWTEQLKAIEHDRRLLAEAWERLERERLSVLDPAPARHPHPTSHTTWMTQPTSNPEQSRRPSDEAIDQSVLRQFEALRQDVRRYSEIHEGTQPKP